MQAFPLLQRLFPGHELLQSHHFIGQRSLVSCELDVEIWDKWDSLCWEVYCSVGEFKQLWQQDMLAENRLPQYEPEPHLRTLAMAINATFLCDRRPPLKRTDPLRFLALRDKLRDKQVCISDY